MNWELEYSVVHQAADESWWRTNRELTEDEALGYAKSLKAGLIAPTHGMAVVVVALEERLVLDSGRGGWRKYGSGA